MTRTAVVTGAAGGIGAALVDAMRAAGYRVVGTDLQEVPSADLSVPIDLERLVNDGPYRDERLRALCEAAGDAVGALVNNAAVQRLGACEALEPADLQASFAVNATAPFVLTRALLGPLEQARGAVINVGSIHARLTKPGFVAYAASKAALEGLTRAMAVELGPRVRVNAISPAAITTPMLEAGFAADPQGRARLAEMHPVEELGTPGQVARLAVLLAEGSLPFLSGAVVALDGAIGARLHDPG